jgi:hypothetical protein
LSLASSVAVAANTLIIRKQSKDEGGRMKDESIILSFQADGQALFILHPSAFIL